jgi:hypothetical protein
MTPVKARIASGFSMRPYRRKRREGVMPDEPHASPPLAETLSHIAAANHRAFTAAARLTARSMQGMADVQQHMVDFVARRLDRDLDSARRLSACKGPGEAMALTQALCAEAVADYAEEATALARVTAGALGDYATPDETDGVALGD